MLLAIRENAVLQESAFEFSHKDFRAYLQHILLKFG